jgi:hypothetical protein
VSSLFFVVILNLLGGSPAAATAAMARMEQDVDEIRSHEKPLGPTNFFASAIFGNGFEEKSSANSWRTKRRGFFNMKHEEGHGAKPG